MNAPRSQASGGCGLVLLAAGGGSRFHGSTHKLLADLDGRPVWQHAVRHAIDAAADRPLAIVTGAQALTPPTAVHLTDTGSGTADVDAASTVDIDAASTVDVVMVHNPGWEHGQGSSLAAAFDWAVGMDLDALVVGLADQPFIPAATWTRILTSTATTPIVAARYAGILGPHPVRLHRSVWNMIDTAGDRGAGPLLRRFPQWVTWVDCLGSTADIDTQEDLIRWTSC